MRRLTIAEGTATVDISHGRAHVHHHGHYVGRLDRGRDGRWSHRSHPQARFAGPAEAAEDLVLTAVLP